MTRRVWLALCVTGLVAVAAGLPPAAPAATVSFLDTMDIAGQAGQYQTFVSGTGEALATVPTSGGNPGAYTDLSLILDVDESVSIARLWNFASYNPSLSGPVTSAVAAYDVRRTFSNNIGATQVAKFVVLLQDGVLRFEFYGVSTNADWEHFASGNLVTDVPEINWATGGEILFGFANSASAGLGIPFTINGGYDNFAVDVAFNPLSAVPEPGTTILLGAALAALAGMAARTRGPK